MFRGWTLVGWTALVSAGLALSSATPEGLDADGLHALVRFSARLSVSLFLVTFVASSLNRLVRSRASRWLLAERRYLGVSFALSHTVHLAALIALGWLHPDPFVSELSALSLYGGGLAYVFIALMTATSFDRTAAWLGRRWWKRLHTVGAWYVWIVFAQSYLPMAAGEPAHRVAAVAVTVAPLLRLAAALARRRR